MRNQSLLLANNFVCRRQFLSAPLSAALLLAVLVPFVRAAEFIPLGTLPGQDGLLESYMRDMTPDGKLIAGKSGIRSGDDNRPFVWSEAGGMEDFEQVLIDSHALGDAFSGWQLKAIQGMSPNGQYFTGHGFNPNGDSEAWLVRLDAPWGTLVPEPTTAAIALLALAPLTMLRRTTRQST